MTHKKIIYNYVDSLTWLAMSQHYSACDDIKYRLPNKLYYNVIDNEFNSILHILRSEDAINQTLKIDLETL